MLDKGDATDVVETDISGVNRPRLRNILAL